MPIRQLKVSGVRNLQPLDLKLGENTERKKG